MPSIGSVSLYAGNFVFLSPSNTSANLQNLIFCIEHTDSHHGKVKHIFLKIGLDLTIMTRFRLSAIQTNISFLMECEHETTY